MYSLPEVTLARVAWRRAVIRQGGNEAWWKIGNGCADPGGWLSFAKSCPEILLCDGGATKRRLLTGGPCSSVRRGCERRRRHDWGDGRRSAGYFKAKHPGGRGGRRLAVSEDKTSETCWTFESHARHAGFQ